MNTTREVVSQALSKHLEADRKLYLQSHICAQIWRQRELMFETISNSNCLINRLTIRQLKRCIKTREKKIKYCYVEFGPDHTNAFSFENSYISMRLGVSSTLRKRIELKTFLTVDQSGYMSYFSLNGHKGKRSPKISQARVLKHAHRVHLTTQREILSFSNVFVWTVGNASKR